MTQIRQASFILTQQGFIPGRNSNRVRLLAPYEPANGVLISAPI